MHLIRIGMNGHVSLVGCPSKPVTLRECHAPLEGDSGEEDLEDVVMIDEEIYEPYEVIALAYGGQRGFRMISKV